MYACVFYLRWYCSDSMQSPRSATVLRCETEKCNSDRRTTHPIANNEPAHDASTKLKPYICGKNNLIYIYMRSVKYAQKSNVGIKTKA